ncbi:hypothetical protein AMAG_03364 [Allomyces macrogynus ATCC 38327]|uniref:Uncharacterized protein n=1 Tax=Allomyces macrogynus (strain ATCC 38327) TaxID=578462 RepID=A0A0L0S8W4_ALLM3|nr:hypothetical protein AMAG_03364 [Allomyces macrogynus ATCC 38327]|eukprot:KNE59013.1 hypothetical protein AMAG_03364 [Allomyces macrogynus ATCC 38327]
MATLFTMSTISSASILSHIAGLTTSVPSLMTHISVLNAVFCGYKGLPLQKAVITFTIAGMLVDVGIFFAMTQWLLDPAWSLWGPVTVGLNIVKRLYSMLPTHLVFLRFTAIVRSFRRARKRAVMYTGVYAFLGVLTVCAHLAAYVPANWVSSKAHESFIYRYVYRVLNIVCVLYYSGLAIYTDIRFISLSKSNPHMQRRFATIRQFYPSEIYVGYEFLMLVIVLSTLILGIFDESVSSAPYNEQFLLALISLNASYSVKAAAILPGDSSLSDTDEATGGMSQSKTGMGMSQFHSEVGIPMSQTSSQIQAPQRAVHHQPPGSGLTVNTSNLTGSTATMSATGFSSPATPHGLAAPFSPAQYAPQSPYGGSNGPRTAGANLNVVDYSRGGNGGDKSALTLVEMRPVQK